MYEDQKHALVKIRSYIERDLPPEAYEVLEHWLEDVAKSWGKMNLDPTQLRDLQAEGSCLLQDLRRRQRM